MEAQAKPFVLFKLAILGFGIGAALLLTPACKAQSEISPDHFDGTDSWAVAAQAVRAPVQKPSVAKASLPAKSKRTAQNSLFQLAAPAQFPSLFALTPWRWNPGGKQLHANPKNSSCVTEERLFLNKPNLT